MQALLNTAIQAARRAGDIAIRSLSRLDQLEIKAKARNEYVTQVDQAAEQAIIESIHKRYPDHAILAEESGARFFNFDGGSSIHGGNCVICAPFLEQELRVFVRPA